MKNNSEKATKAYIYTRVSTGKQVTFGHGLEAQLAECQEYCKRNGLEVIGHYEDAGCSARKMQVPQLFALLEVLNKRRNIKSEPVVVVAYSMSRTSRNMRMEYELIRHEDRYNCQFRYVKEDVGRDAAGKLQRNILSSFNQYEAEFGAERVRDKMNARKEAGHRVHGHAPAWYHYVNGVYTPFQPNANIVAQMYEHLATGALPRNKRAVIDFMASRGFIDKKGNLKPPSYHQIDSLFKEKNIMECAGFLNGDDKWIPAKHEAIITKTLAMKVIAKLNQKEAHKHRINLSSLYPLKGAVLCDGCGAPLTGYAPNKSDYSYYCCRKSGCEYKDKSTPQDMVHKQFEALLDAVTPSPVILKVAAELMKDAWEAQTEAFSSGVASARRRLQLCDEKIQKATQDSVKAPNDVVRDALYKEIQRLSDERVSLELLVENSRVTENDFQLALSRIQLFLENPKEA